VAIGSLPISILTSASGPPAYIQLRESLRGLITTGVLSPGERMPTERAIADSLDISRITVRRATSDLAKAGLLVRRHGSGTYIAAVINQQGSVSLGGFAAELTRQGRVSEVRVRSIDRVLADPAAQAALRLAEGAAVIRLVRVRLVDSSPCSLETSWLPESKGSYLLHHEIEEGALFQTLRAHSNFNPTRAVERLNAQIIAPAQAAELGSNSGQAAFALARTTYDDTDDPIEYAHTLLRADRFSFATGQSPEFNPVPLRTAQRSGAR